MDPRQVKTEYSPLPPYVKNGLDASFRRYFQDESSEVFTQIANTYGLYDAYEDDIAVVNFYFDTPTVFEYIRAPSMTWTGFLSQVGGLMGLCLGFRYCTVV